MGRIRREGISVSMKCMSSYSGAEGLSRMLPGPAIDVSVVLEALRQEYGLPVDRITFLTTSWVSRCYRAEIAVGQSYLLKLYDESMPAPLLATSRNFYLPLSHELCTRGLLPHIACPVRARDGRFSVRAGSYLLILFHFIEGEPVGFRDLPDEILVKLAGLVGRLHRSTGALDLVNPLVEGFQIAFEDALPAGLEVLANPGPNEHAGWRGFQELLLPRRSEILGYLDRLKELQAKDTFWDRFWPHYEREFGPAQLDADTLGFYYYRRGLEDLAEWIQRLLYSHQGGEQDRSALHWAAETVASLSNAEAKLNKIAAHLLHG